jgi:hypothetical protein
VVSSTSSTLMPSMPTGSWMPHCGIHGACTPNWNAAVAGLNSEPERQRHEERQISETASATCFAPLLGHQHEPHADGGQQHQAWSTQRRVSDGFQHVIHPLRDHDGQEQQRPSTTANA